jgi:hypothetical protein
VGGSQSSSIGFADADAAKTGAVIVSAGDVLVYTMTGKLTARITGMDGPQGLAVDTAGDLYIATGTRGILVYKNDYKTLIATLLDQYPALGVAVDSTTGVVAAINTYPSPVGNIMFYPKGASTPCANLFFKNVGGFFQGTFDKGGNLYVTANLQSGRRVVGVIRGGCSAKALTILSTANVLYGPWGIQITPTGKIAVADRVENEILTYDPPGAMKDTLGKPIATTPLGVIETNAQFAFTKNGAYLFIAGLNLDKAVKYAYPAGGNPIEYIGGRHLYGPIGLVVTPAANN